MQPPGSGSCVEEVVEPAVIVERVPPKVAQRGDNAGASLFFGDPTPVRADAKGGKTETGCGEASYVAAGLSPVHASAIHNDARGGPGLLPEIGKTAFGVVFEEVAFFRFEGDGRGGDPGCGLDLVRQSQCARGGKQKLAPGEARLYISRPHALNISNSTATQWPWPAIILRRKMSVTTLR